MNIKEIENEIERLEQAENSWNNIQKLASLYIVCDRWYDGEEEHQNYSYDDKAQAKNIVIASEVQKVMPNYDGELGEAMSGKDIGAIMNILTEHFSVIKVLYPKEYDAVLERIAQIQ